MTVLLISTYDLGRQPFGLASPAGWLRDAGVDVACVDLTRERLDLDTVRAAELVAFFLPMHTATRLALPVIDRLRELNPAARLAAYGLYAPLNASLLRERGVQHILGGEFEADLVALALGCEAPPAAGIPRLEFKAPARETLPPLARYACLQVGDQRRVAGYTEASRGCKHLCRHCPIVPVYNGIFRTVPPDIVMADVHAQVRAGARHITFGDPDFFNGPRHAVAVVERFARECPGITYDVTVKVEHLLKHADLLPVLRDTGCAFVTSAVESLDDAVLARLAKGHSRADFERAVALCRGAAVALSPTFVAFTPWTTMEGYLDLLRTLDRLELVEHVAPIQMAIRLLVPEGSLMLDLPEMRKVTGRFDPVSLTYPWTHPDPAMDALQRSVWGQVAIFASARELQSDPTQRAQAFAHVWELAHAHAGVEASPRHQPVLVARAAFPYLNEPWYC